MRTHLGLAGVIARHPVSTVASQLATYRRRVPPEYRRDRSDRLAVPIGDHDRCPIRPT